MATPLRSPLVLSCTVTLALLSACAIVLGFGARTAAAGLQLPNT